MPEQWMADLMYFGNKTITLSMGGGHDTLTYAAIDGMVYTLEDPDDMSMLVQWSQAVRQDPQAPPPSV